MSDVPPDPDPIVEIGSLKAPWFYIRDTKGEGSLTVTLVMVSFLLTSLAYVLSIVEKIGPVTIRPFYVGACGVFFAPILALYFGRKHTDANAPTK